MKPLLGSFSEHETNNFGDQTAVDLFECMIDSDIIDMFLRESNRNALSKNCRSLNITSDEFRCFFAILILATEKTIRRQNSST
jgi:hypothetical protein